MKKVIVAGLVAAALCLGTPALAQNSTVNDQYDDELMHPLRVASYLIYPIGFAAEWLIGRPFQYIISRDQLRNVFGWKPANEEGSYRKVSRRM